MDNPLSLKEIQAKELEILVKFDEICSNNNLSYSLAWGAMIGAVRHRGFIPWDDDIDVIMPRKDLIKFKNIFLGMNNSNLTLLDNHSEGYYYPFPKLCDNRTVAKMADNKTVHGIWMDIFPVDNLPESKLEMKILHFGAIICKALIISFTTDFKHAGKNRKNTLKKFLNFVGSVIGKRRVAVFLDKWVQHYDNRDGSRISAISWQTSFKGNLNSNVFNNMIRVPFEGKRFPIINDYKKFMTEIYGDYMQLPPKEKRQTHHLEAYNKVD